MSGEDNPRPDSASPTAAPVRIAVAPNPTVAAMWQEALREAGIVALVRNRDAVASTYGVPGFAYSCEILVMTARADDARAILADLGAFDP